jgi:hypothetical protein
MKQQASAQLSKVRQGQRSHAKQRFKQRFDLEMNRDRIHEIERKICNRQAVAIESRHGKENYFVEIDGKLIVVGYDGATHRVVTALPDEYLQNLSPTTVKLARLKLLPSEQSRVLGDIIAGKARLLHQTESTAFYEVQYDGLSVQTGYDAVENRLCPYRKPNKKSMREPALGVASDLPPKAPLPPLMELDPGATEDLLRQIHDGTSRLLWRYSNTVTFQQVELNGQKLEVGYSRSRRAFHEYMDPPEDRTELRSSLRLLGGTADVLEAVMHSVREGKAELVCMRDHGIGSYRVDYKGETYYFDYSNSSGDLEPWNQGR